MNYDEVDLRREFARPIRFVIRELVDGEGSEWGFDWLGAPNHVSRKARFRRLRRWKIQEVSSGLIASVADGFGLAPALDGWGTQRTLDLSDGNVFRIVYIDDLFFDPDRLIWWRCRMNDGDEAAQRLESDPFFVVTSLVMNRGDQPCARAKALTAKFSGPIPLVNATAFERAIGAALKLPATRNRRPAQHWDLKVALMPVSKFLKVHGVSRSAVETVMALVSWSGAETLICHSALVAMPHDWCVILALKTDWSAVRIAERVTELRSVVQAAGLRSAAVVPPPLVPETIRVEDVAALAGDNFPSAAKVAKLAAGGVAVLGDLRRSSVGRLQKLGRIGPSDLELIVLALGRLGYRYGVK